MIGGNAGVCDLHEVAESVGGKPSQENSAVSTTELCTIVACSKNHVKFKLSIVNGKAGDF
jgi:hypothetical protein